MTKILIVDDEEKLRKLLRKYAEFEGYEVEEAGNGMEAVEKCRKETFDLIIMDIMMPELDGFSAVKEIRKTMDVPVIMLSARGEEYDKIHGFEVGVDDYVVKPFSSKEVMMRIDAILRRSAKKADPAEASDHITYTKDGLLVDVTAHKVFVDSIEVAMPAKEYELLSYLISNRNIALTRNQLLHDVWGYDYYGDDRTLDTHVKLLRQTLGSYANLIVTVRGFGYRFEG